MNAKKGLYFVFRAFSDRVGKMLSSKELSLVLLKSLPFQIALTVLCGFFISPLLPLWALNLGYTAGVFFKDLLMIFIPFVVAGYLMSSLVSFEKRSLWLVLGIVALTIFSSFLTIMASYGLAIVSFPLLSLGALSLDVCALTCPLETLWVIPFKSPLTPSVAIIIALILGMVAVIWEIAPLKQGAEFLRDQSTRILKRYFVPFLPIYVLSVVLKIQSEGTLGILLKGYGKVFCALHGFILLSFVGATIAVAHLTGLRLRVLFKNLFSTVIAALSTMSGVATMPFLVEGISDVLRNKIYPGFVIPLTTNIHTVGDGFCISVTAFALLVMTQGKLPGFHMVLIYTFYYCLARFFSACVPGGGALIMAPFVRDYLGLAPEFIGLLITLYMLQDPLITLWNTLGNGLFVLSTKPFFAKYLPKTLHKQIKDDSLDKPLLRKIS